LAGLRTIVLRQSGRRTDPGHALAHDCADVVWVPQHERLEPHIAQTKRISYSGAFSRYDDRRLETCPFTSDSRRGSVRKRVVVLLGAGGSAFPERTWTQGGSPAGVDVVVLGSEQRWAAGAVQSLGHVDDPLPFLLAADAVISSAGWASVHDLASLGIPNAVVAEARPFDEQTVRAAALNDAGLVVALDGWPAPANLGAVLEQCDALAPDRWAPFYDGRGARRAATIISEVHHGRP
jgi:hypothetical protein